MDKWLTTGSLVSLLTLTFLEIILGIDNIIFISILSEKLPAKQRSKARNMGLVLALFVRIALLFGISWIIGLKKTLISLFGFDLSGKDIILLGGGLFLLAKSTSEIHQKLEGDDQSTSDKKLRFWSAILQIILLDIVFSFDSILTAVGLVNDLPIMIASVVISLIVMMLFSGMISSFIHRHPSMKMLALSFLIMIGMLLVVEAFHVHVPKGYVYFAMAFSLGVEVLNMRVRKRSSKPVKLRESFEQDDKKKD